MDDSDDDHDDDHDDDNYDGDEQIIARAPSLYNRPTFFRQTRKRGKIWKTVNECYLRDDLGFGCYYVDEEEEEEEEEEQGGGGGGGGGASQQRKKRRNKQIDTVLGKPRTIESVDQLLSLIRPCQPHAIVICDTNVLLHNLDVLEQAAGGEVMPNIVIPQTALMECRSNRMVSYDRTVDLLRSVSSSGSKRRKQQQQKQRCCIFFADPHHVATAHVDENISSTAANRRTINDENDARIRNVAAYYGEQLQGSGVRVVLLTDDAGSRKAAEQESGALYESKSVRKWVQELEKYNPGKSFSDLVAQYGGNPTESRRDGQGNNRVSFFSPHVDASALSRGIQSGLYHRGVLRSTGSTTSDNDQTAMVTIRKGTDRVAVTIRGSNDRNRAVDGDVVAIALHPLDQWISSTTTTTAPTKSIPSSATVEAGIANETAEPTVSEMDNVPETLSINDAAKSLRPTGEVVGIIRRNFDNHSGSIYERENFETSTSNKTSQLSERDQLAADLEREHPDGTTTCVFFPVNKKIPPILIRTTQRERLLSQRIIVAMDSWPAHSPLPLGHYVRTIGPAGSKDVETDVLLQQFNIPHQPFPAAVLACLPAEDYSIDNENSPGRVDLRHLPILSVDPPGCKDIDDALHCIVLENGNYQVGVHIADVTHYVKPGTAIDLEAANRSTSTYLVNKRLDMLPSLLTTDLCSLKGNVDRYAFSVLWEVTPDANIVNVDFKKSLIHSIAALTYQQAQSHIDQADDPSDIQGMAIKRLASLARKFRKRRLDAGALTLASPEVKFVLDSESLNPTDVQAYALLEANAMVEEFMLLANVTVAKKILRNYPTLSVLRRHPAPNRAMFDGLISKAKSRGLVLDIEDSKRLADSLDKAQIESDPFINKLIRILSTRCMSPAQYFCSGEFRPTEWHHYGLAAPVYTHFTSPIRRYADVCVHRLLASAIGVDPLPPHLSSKSYLHDLCANMNRRHRSAQLAGRASVQLHTLIFFADAAKEEDAYVLDLETAESTEPSFSVFVPRYGIEGRVKLDVAADDPGLQRFPDEHRISYAKGGKSVSVQVFDKVRVRVWVREFQDHQRELVLDLLEPQFGAQNNAGKHQRTPSGKAETLQSPEGSLSRLTKRRKGSD